MRKITKQPKRKPKKKLRYSKRQNPKGKKDKMKKSNIIKIVPESEEEPDFLKGIKQSPMGLRTYDPKDSRFNGFHAYNFTLQDFQWMGLLTLKFYSYSHSKDDYRGEGRKNRTCFLKKFMENLRVKIGISDREFNWFACEEFGFTGMGHLHVIFSFDYLKEKNRMDRIKISDYSENGQFYQEARESVDFISQKLSLNLQSVDLHWVSNWKNEGLVDYFTKIEFGREDKSFFLSDFWKKRGLEKAA
jgi:hypothetical protein